MNTLIQNWNDLLKASNERGKGLEEVKDILKFNEEVDKVEAWIREKVQIIIVMIIIIVVIIIIIIIIIIIVMVTFYIYYS